MRLYPLAAALLIAPLAGCDAGATAETSAQAETTTERNKRLALEFYEKLWLSNNTDAYADYVAEEYQIHDIGDQPDSDAMEPGVTQKEIADFWHSMGTMSGQIDYQIAEGDKVATRWYWSLEPNDQAIANGMEAVNAVPIINVFRFNDEGKIVEIWNHRHDISLPRPPGPPPEKD